MTAEIGRAFLRLIFFKTIVPRPPNFQIKDLGHVSCNLPLCTDILISSGTNQLHTRRTTDAPAASIQSH